MRSPKASSPVLLLLLTAKAALASAAVRSPAMSLSSATRHSLLEHRRIRSSLSANKPWAAPSLREKRSPPALQARAASSSSLLPRRAPAGLALVSRGDRLGLRVHADAETEERALPWYFDVGTKGGALSVPLMTIVFPLTIYYGLQANGVSAERAGPWASFIYLFGGLIAWTFTYLYRVATKQMTYVQQLKDYEDAVMMKRLEEMGDDEIQQMLEDAEQMGKEFQAQNIQDPKDAIKQ
eukprot:CAMPEP_0114496130 /NCGR_PEP_ID=MMETSP0109-20121206/5602_1 /TAXON_ID=29199 /ORGANISM="Chlorarachnion reptans, Strain CCCM449" /LENGTH=237 /DNA_ID=CAMNT_0001673375 /DNA_START=25 /DNA_END=738 /DNA_ORIENTATION=+